MGTGAVAFNIAPRRALLCDSNPHLIAFYTAIQEGRLTPERVREHLGAEGARLAARGESHYYEIRDRFNELHDPLDFLFVNRAGFNGMIRFNRTGGLNIPFCRKPERFSKAYITKIANQVENVARIVAEREFTFARRNFDETIEAGVAADLIYCDPPYVGRHVDYFNGWSTADEHRLFELLSSSPSRFILSTWHHNAHRANAFIPSLWQRFEVMTAEHFYHVGGRTSNRKPMIEALVTNYRSALPVSRAMAR